MFEVKQPGKKIKTVLNDLGSDYEIKVIDAEQCIYRNLNNGYDIEVSGLNNQRKSFEARVYVWNTKDGTRIVERNTDIASFEELKKTLDDLSIKYS